MGTLKDELVKAGLVKEEDLPKAPKQEFIQGEIVHTMQSETSQHARYHKPIVTRFKKERHGRTIRMHPERKINTGSVLYKMFACMNASPKPMSINDVINYLKAANKEVAKPSVNAYISKMAKYDLIKRLSAVGERGFVYSINGKHSNEDLYMKYLAMNVKDKPERVSEESKAERRKEKKEPVSQAAGIPSLINVVVSGQIQIVFKLG